VPIGLASFAWDMKTVRKFAERDHTNIVSWNEFDRGSHWAAHDAPDLLIGDIRQLFRFSADLCGSIRGRHGTRQCLGQRRDPESSENADQDHARALAAAAPACKEEALAGFPTDCGCAG
jgi:hypothetical protein